VLILRHREYVHCSLRGSIEQFFSRNNKSFVFQFIDRKGVFYKSKKRPKQPPPKTRLQLKDVDTSYNGHLQTKHGLDANHTSAGRHNPPKPLRGKRQNPILQRRVEPGRSCFGGPIVQAAGLDSGLNPPTDIGAPNARPP
jgi:hypothetical protein